jgi:hypothetical protein
VSDERRAAVPVADERYGHPVGAEKPAERCCSARRTGGERVRRGEGSRRASSRGIPSVRFAPTAARTRLPSATVADLDRFDAGGGHRVERGAELRIPVADQETEPVGPFVEVHQQVPGRLRDPRAGRVGDDAGQVDPAVIELDHEQDVQAGQADALDGEEVAGEGAGGLGAHLAYRKDTSSMPQVTDSGQLPHRTTWQHPSPTSAPWAID